MSFAVKPGKKKRKSIKSFILLFFVKAGIGIFVYLWVFHLPYFYLKEIRIEGLQKIPPQQIREKISLPPATSIFTVDLKKIYSAVKTHPMVKKAKIIKKLPSTLVVKIEERNLFAYIKEENSFLQIDREGFIFGQTEKPLSSFTVISGINPSTDREIIQKILGAIDRCNFLNLKVKKASFEKDERGIVLFLEKDLKVILGLSPNYHYLSYLSTILEDARKNSEKFDTIDLRFDRQIVVFKEK